MRCLGGRHRLFREVDKCIIATNASYGLRQLLEPVQVLRGMMEEGEGDQYKLGRSEDGKGR